MKLKTSVFLFTATIFLLVSCATATSTPVVETQTQSATVTPEIDPVVVMNAKRAEVLSYITDLSNAPFKGVISGQNAYHGTEILGGYTTMIEKLHLETGKYVGIAGVDYEFAKLFKPSELSQTNQVLLQHADAGGLVMITLAPQNPWVNDESDLVGNPGSWNGPAAINNVEGMALVNLNDLIDPSKPVHAAWMRKLDRVAGGLQELRDAGAVVLFRPMQEMNGNWFWWGMKSHPNDPAPYINVYRHMYDYFTNDKGLNNLIWVYSPNSSFGVDNSADWNRTVDWAYPGDDYVDIVAGTNYDDSMTIVDYPVYVSMNKPLGIAEFGPSIGGPVEADGTWDTAQIITRFEKDYPRLAFWVSWHSYPAQHWSIISNQNYNALMNDPHVITRDDFKWSWLPE